MAGCLECAGTAAASPLIVTKLLAKYYQRLWRDAKRWSRSDLVACRHRPDITHGLFEYYLSSALGISDTLVSLQNIAPWKSPTSSSLEVKYSRPKIDFWISHESHTDMRR